MKKIFLLLAILFFTQAAFGCDATILPQKTYVFVSQSPIKQFKVTDTTILSAEMITSIFGEKNQLVVRTKNTGKTNMLINDKNYKIEVSKEQKDEWNIVEINCFEIDNPPVIKDEMNEK